MQGSGGRKRGAFWARGFAALCAAFVIVASVCSRAAQAAPSAYVTSGNIVSVIDTATNKVTANITVPGGASVDRVSPDGTRLYVSGGGLSVIDTFTNTIVATIPAPVGSAGAVPAITPDGKRLYVTAGFSVVYVIDTATYKTIATIPGAGGPGGTTAVSPDGKRVYSVNYNSNYVSVIDTSTNTLVTNVTVGPHPDSVAVTPDSKYAYVTIYGAGDGTNGVAVIDTATNKVAATIHVQHAPSTLAISPDGRRVYVTNTCCANSVSVHVVIWLTGTKQYLFLVKAYGASLTGIANPVPVTLTIGSNIGSTQVTGTIVP